MREKNRKKMKMTIIFLLRSGLRLLRSGKSKTNQCSLGKMIFTWAKDNFASKVGSFFHL